MERLQKVMAEAGVASRRRSEELISAGRVRVDGRVITKLGTKVAAHAKIEVDGAPIEREGHVYFLLDKPRGVITSVNDEKKRKTVLDLLAGVDRRVYPVGRLDYDTSGLLVITNDGALTEKLTHPRFKINKTYIAKVGGIVTVTDLKRLERGIVIDRRKTAPAHAKLLSVNREKRTSIVELTIHEGRHHQVKNMLKRIEHPVEKLRRVAYGPLTIDGLQPGKWRPMKPEEIKQLQDL